MINLKDHPNTVLSILAVIGVGLTAWQTARASVKIYKRYLGDTDDKRVIKESIPDLIPPIISGAGTIACIVLSNKLSLARETQLLGAFTGVSEGYRLYSDTVHRKCPEVDQAARERGFIKSSSNDFNDIINDVHEVKRWFDRESKRFYKATTEEQFRAEYHLNRDFIMCGSTTLGKYYNYLDNYDCRPRKGDYDIGWTEYGDAFYGYRWIDFTHTPKTDQYGDYIEVDFPFPPTDEVRDVS